MQWGGRGYTAVYSVEVGGIQLYTVGRYGVYSCIQCGGRRYTAVYSVEVGGIQLYTVGR